MTALAPHLPYTLPGAQPVTAPGTEPDRAALLLLRLTGARCRAMARSDLFRACAMLSENQSRAAEAVATALLRSLNGTGGLPKMQLYQLNSPEISFDEHWLLAALEASRRGDTDSLTFLLARRLPVHARRQIGFLIAALTTALDCPDLAA